jgi:hypothetical protein
LVLTPGAASDKHSYGGRKIKTVTADDVSENELVERMTTAQDRRSPKLSTNQEKSSWTSNTSHRVTMLSNAMDLLEVGGYAQKYFWDAS